MKIFTFSIAPASDVGFFILEKMNLDSRFPPAMLRKALRAGRGNDRSGARE